MFPDLLKYHQWCISDPIAMSAYREAIRKTVRPDDVVVDLGAGTGILSYMACEAGAGKVYAIEPGEIIALIPDIAADNGFVDQIVWKKASSFHADLPEKADVMIASMLGSAGIGNNMLDVVIDARERLLKPGGAVIPRSVQPVFCPVELADWYEHRIDCWNVSRSGFEFRTARSVAVNRVTIWNVTPANLLASPQSFDVVDLPTLASPDIAATLSFEIQRSGTIHAIAGWTEVKMVEGILCSSSPLDPNSMPWEQMVLPLESATSLNPGDRVLAAVRTRSVGMETVLTWDVSIRDSKGSVRAEFHHSTFEGALWMAEDLKRRAPAFVPNVSDWGRAELAVLQQIDGVRTLDQIAASVLECFPSILKNLRNARAFVAEVVGRSCTSGQW
jgi:protein arginine N-methyltransferase 1